MKLLPLALALCLLSLGVAACGDDDDGDGGGEVSTEDFAPVTAPPDDAEEGGTIEVIAAGDVDYMDPGAMYYQFSYQVVGYTMHRQLLSWPPDETAEPQPDVAEEQPEISENGQTITYTIREGINFGPPVDREVTSADVKYAIERTLLPGVANGYASTYLSDIVGWEDATAQAEDEPTAAPDIEGIKAPDDRTLVIKLDQSTAIPIVQALSLPMSSPVPEEYAKEFDAESPSTYGEHAVATGPYMVENNEQGELIGWEPGKEIHLVRNPNWDPETDYRPAYVDEILVREGFTDVASASRKILEGESQVQGDILPEPPSIKLAATEHPDQLTIVPGAGNRFIAMNTTIPPFDDINVRKAVVAAADREAFRLARGGELVGDIATHFIFPGIPGFEEAGGYEGAGLDYLSNPQGDPELAAKYMRKAGYESGEYEGNEEVLLVGENAGVDKRVTEVALDLFEGLGFNVEAREVGPNVMYTRFCQVPAAEVAICPTVGWLEDFNDGAALLPANFSGDAIIPKANYNYSQLDVPEINEAMEEANLLTDPEERAQAWGEIDTMVMEQAPVIPYLWDTQPNIRSANVNGVINLFNASWDMSFTSVDQG